MRPPRRKRRLIPASSNPNTSMRRRVEKSGVRAPAANLELPRDELPEEDDENAIVIAPPRGPTSDLGQDPVALQRALTELRVEHEELWLTATELKQRLREVELLKRDLEQKVSFYRDLFQFAAEAQIVTDIFGLIHAANPGACLLLQGDSTPVAGLALSTFVASGGAGALDRSLAEITAGRPTDVSFSPRNRFAGAPVVFRGVLLGAQRGDRLRNGVFAWLRPRTVRDGEDPGSADDLGPACSNKFVLWTVRRAAPEG